MIRRRWHTVWTERWNRKRLQRDSIEIQTPINQGSKSKRNAHSSKLHTRQLRGGARIHNGILLFCKDYLMISDTVNKVCDMLYNDLKDNQVVILFGYVRNWTDVTSFVQASNTKTIDLALLREEIEWWIKSNYSRRLVSGKNLKDMLWDL